MVWCLFKYKDILLFSVMTDWLVYWSNRLYLIAWSRVLLEKVTVRQLIKKSPTFYGIQSFINMFTREFGCILDRFEPSTHKCKFNILLLHIIFKEIVQQRAGNRKSLSITVYPCFTTKCHMEVMSQPKTPDGEPTTVTHCRTLFLHLQWGNVFSESIFINEITALFFNLISVYNQHANVAVSLSTIISSYYRALSILFHHSRSVPFVSVSTPFLFYFVHLASFGLPMVVFCHHF